MREQDPFSSWTVTTVDAIKDDEPGSVAIGPFGSRMKSELYVADGVPVIMGRNLSDTRSLKGPFVFVSNATADELRSSNVQAGDLVFPHRGSIGAVGIVPSDGYDRYMLSTSLMKLRCNDKVADPNFVYYFFRSQRGRSELLKYASTVGTPGIGQPLTSLRLARLPLPPIKMQRAIVDVLLAIDEKIESNLRLCANLDSLVRAEVQFAQMSAEASTTLGCLVERVNDIVNPEDFDAATVYVGLEHVPRGSLFLTEWSNAEALSSAKARFHVGDILFGKLRPYFQKVSIAPCSGVCSTDILVLRPVSQDVSAFAAVVCASDEVINYASAGSHGTKMPRVSWEYLASWKVATPGQETVRELQRRLSPMLHLGVHMTYESVALAAIRDTLLPKLLSGELRVHEAESLIEEAI